MSEFKKCFSDSEKLIYLKGLIFILGKGKKLTKGNLDYLRKQAEEIGWNGDIKEIKRPPRPKDMINELAQICDIRVRRFIIREMVMLSVADHEISDEEMLAFYTIGKGCGIKEDKVNDFFLWAAEGIEWQMKGISLIKDDL